MSTISKTQSQINMPSSEAVKHGAAGFGSNATFWQTFQNAMVITRREVRDSFRDWRIMAPIVLLTLCFPALANIASAAFINFFDRYGADGDTLVDSFLPLMPMIVGFFPVSISLVIALETFVGEKERRSIEPLLSTPLTNTELYMGKVLAATLPPLFAAYLGITIYIGGLVLGAQQWRPDIILVLQIVSLTTVQALVMVTGAVVISSQTTSTRAANLLASLIILPMSLLVIAESIIMVQPDERFVLWWFIAALMVVIVLLVRTGTRIFNREELLGRAVDQLNFKWIARTYWDQVCGITHEERDAHENFGEPLPTNKNILAWYRNSIFPVFTNLRRAGLTLGITVIAAFIGGWYVASIYTLPIDREPPSDEINFVALMTSSLDTVPYVESEAPATVAEIPEDFVETEFNSIVAWENTVAALEPVEVRIERAPWQFTDEELLTDLRGILNTGVVDPGTIGAAIGGNIRLLGLAYVLGMFTFGALAIILVAAPFGALGYVLGNMVINGVSMVPLLITLLPYGIFEAAALLIGGALVLRSGSVTTGDVGKLTVGEVWLRAVADSAKTYFMVVVPLLLIAATLEVVLTPQLVELALEIGF